MITYNTSPLESGLNVVYHETTQGGLLFPVQQRTYFAVIGDLVGSRELDDRARVQARLQEGIRALNEALSARLAAPLKLTAGDEVQGLTQVPEVLASVVFDLSDAVFPAQISWGLGRGPLATDLGDDVSLLDGPCFHRARDAVETAKGTSRWLATGGFREPEGTVLAGLMNLIGAIRSDWTPRQAEVVRAARGRKQIQVAGDLEVNRSTVSRTLSAAHYARILEGEEAARALLRASSQLPESS